MRRRTFLKLGAFGPALLALQQLPARAAWLPGAPTADGVSKPGAERVIVPYTQDPLLLRPQDGTAEIERRSVREGVIGLSSSHPQSTCRMGADPARSVVNSWGELHDAEGSFVADRSVFPTSLGVPPQITTAALAFRNSWHLQERWSELRG